jgi:hypothetical protein
MPTATLEPMTFWVCDGCEEITADGDQDAVGPLYECADCGTRFARENSADGESHRCPDCNKFGRKISEYCCPDCGEDELKPVSGFSCGECDAVFDEYTLRRALGEHEKE